MARLSEGRDLHSELDDFDGEYPESWIPDVGDIIVGEVLRYDTGTTDYGRYPICVLRNEETGEERGVWLLHTVLLNEFKEKRPKPGERVGIKRLPDGGKGYKRYAVRVDREEPEVPDFDRYDDLRDVPPADREALRDAPGPVHPDAETPPPEDDDYSEEALLAAEHELPF